MTDRSIRIKPFSRQATGSLARRVLYGGLALLGLPLLIHTLLLYHREYRQNEKDAFQMLRLLAESRALYIEQMVHNQQDILNALSNDIPEQEESRKEFLVREANDYHVQELLYVELTASGPVCDHPVCRDPTFRPFLDESAKREQFVFINPHASEKNNWLYVGRTLPSSRNPKALILIATQTDELLNRLEHLDDSSYPIRLSLIDESGKIFLSTEQGLQGENFAQSTDLVSWIPEKEVSNAWFFKSKNGKYLAVKLSIGGTDYTLMLDVPQKSIEDLQMRSYLFRIVSFLLIVCLLGGAILAWLTNRISKPLRSLGAVMQRVSEGSAHARFQEDRMGFEINVLGLQLNRMLDSLIAHQQEAERERIARERLAQELRIGHQIQASMLPTELPNFPSLEITPGYLAAREVSGDFYDFFTLKDGRLLIAMADAADKGISACLYSLSFRSMLRTAAATQHDLASMVSVASSLLLHDTAATSSFITAWIGLYDPEKKELVFCSQGHPPAYLRKANGELLVLSSPGMALGIQEIHPNIERLQLSVGDLLFLYTDGVIEAHDIDRQLFGEKRLKEFLHRSKNKSTQAIVDQLLEEIHVFCSGAPQADDLTLLSIRIH